MRCNACKYDPNRGSGRFTLRQHPDRYKRAIRCPHCGGTDRIRSVEKHRRDEHIRRPSHSCANYPFPHVAGTLRMCVEHPEYMMGFSPSQEEYDAHQAVLNTPRSDYHWGPADVSSEVLPDSNEVPM